MSLEERAFRKATRRLIPFLFLIYVVAYLDRVNVSFAQLQLEEDLGFSDTVFGIGAGIFSLGYVIFGVPSNLALERFGARRWLAAIMILWGLISMSMLFIVDATSFYVLRFLLGAAEAGFFPGIILFLTWWFPERERTRVLALFLTAISVAYVAGGPLSGGLLELDGVLGLDGWQWLFLVEGLPAVVLGWVTLRFLDEGPEEAAWLEPEERAFLAGEVARERELKAAIGGQGLGDALRSGQVWLLSLVYFLIIAAAFGLTFFVPDLVQDRTGYSDFEVGVLSAVPYGFATAAMLVIARRADRAPSRRPYVAATVLVGAVGCVATAYAESPLALTVAITLSAVGLLSAIPVFWAFPTALLGGTAAAAGIALIAAIGNLGGFAGPAFTGISEDSTGGFEMPLTVLAGLLVVGAALMCAGARAEGPGRRRAIGARYQPFCQAIAAARGRRRRPVATTTMFATIAAGSQRGTSRASSSPSRVVPWASVGPVARRSIAAVSVAVMNRFRLTPSRSAASARSSWSGRGMRRRRRPLWPPVLRSGAWAGSGAGEAGWSRVAAATRRSPSSSSSVRSLPRAARVRRPSRLSDMPSRRATSFRSSSST